MEIEDVLYFPSSPVNILSITALATQLQDDDGTGIDTKRTSSRLYWDNGKYERTIIHPKSNLPELPINEGFSFSSLYSTTVGRVFSTTKHHCHCHASQLIPDTSEQRPNPLLELSDDMFHVGETLLYTNAGHTVYARVEKIFLGDNATLRFLLRTKDDDLIEATKESLRAPDAPDIGWIPATVPEKEAASATIPPKELEKISNPTQLSPLQEEFLALHERCWHLPFSTMFRLVKWGFLPAKFRKLKNKAPPCVPCLFGQAHR